MKIGTIKKTEWPADKVKRRLVAELIPYARNARTHSDAQVAQIAASITEWGWTTPVLVDETGSIIAGHGRVMAARKLGLKDVPVMVASGWSESQKRAYVLADNQLALNAGWDIDLLKIEIGDLDAEGFNLDLIGFDDKLLADLMAEPAEGLTDEDDTPKPPADPLTVLGDVWVLGNHRLMCGDSTSIDAFTTLMGGERADMIFTDPPYGMFYNEGHLWRGHVGIIINDDLQGDALIALVRDAIATSSACMKKGGALYTCFTWRTYAEFEAGLESCGHKVKACIVWDKKSFGLGNSNYRSQHEFIFYCGGQWYGDKSESDVWYMSRGSTGDYVHPTQKPVELVERALKNSSKAGDIVIDCFGGSGSTLIAAEKNSRHSRLMELDPKYCDVIVTRWQDFTGQKAIHEETGKTFEEMKGEKCSPV